MCFGHASNRKGYFMRSMTLALVVAAVLAAPGTLFAGSGSRGDWELGVYGGYAWLDDYGFLHPKDSPLFGARLGYFLTSAWSLEASAQRIFSETDLGRIDGARETGTDRIELYTEPYADHYTADRAAAIAPFVKAARHAAHLGIGLNAGHDLSLQNLAYFHQQIPGLLEVSIGHALVCDALYLGLEQTIAAYLRCLQ